MTDQPLHPRDNPANESRAEPRPDSARELSADKDLSPLLHEWEYESGSINVRKVRGLDGRPKLQMRLELGVLQMEMTGRPDGVRPHGHDSLLEYFESLLTEHRSRNGTSTGFSLTGDQCQGLREEAAMYYQRYLSLYVLNDFDGVVRDTSRNLRVLDFCGKWATDDQDKLVLEQYRPYILMMNARGQASLLCKGEKYNDALDVVKAALAAIRRFFDKFDHPEAYDACEEVKVLKRLARDIRRKIPVGLLERLNRKLKKAVQTEDYELAAKLRDQIAAMDKE